MAETTGWERIYSINRVGQEKLKQEVRSGFQRDFDRLVFSSAFRRLQNKTQVFPLPGSTFVHNRLTHSLEVASVGRSLGKMVGAYLAETEVWSDESQEFYRYELSNVIAAACLAHDIGNPAFGHSGEKALSSWFSDNAARPIGGKSLESFFEAPEWMDLTNFEGNANAFRILTHSFRGKLPGGFGLTYTTLGSILKYPCDSASISSSPHRKKYGFFQSELPVFKEVTEELFMVPDPSASLAFKRHPFVYLTEAADDICYQVIDIEDAHRLGIITLSEAEGHLLEVMSSIGRPQDNMERVKKTLSSITDSNEKISYLRARCINTLTLQAADIFIEEHQRILDGDYNATLIGTLKQRFGALDKIEALSVDKIYNHESVIQIEIAGYHVMSKLLDAFVPPLLKSKPDPRDKKMMLLIPDQFKDFGPEDRPYKKVRGALDYISGMTDLYATELYRKLTGIDIPIH